MELVQKKKWNWFEKNYLKPNIKLNHNIYLLHIFFFTPINYMCQIIKNNILLFLHIHIHDTLEPVMLFWEFFLYVSQGIQSANWWGSWHSTNMPAFGGIVARLKKSETLQGIYRSHLDKISQDPNVPTEKSIALPSRLAMVVLPKKTNCKQLQWKIRINYPRTRAIVCTVVIFKHLLINCSPICLGNSAKQA